jgi:hypothetical protein
VILGQKLEGNNISLLCGDSLGIEGQSSALADLDSEVRGTDASGKTQESGNDGNETHVSEKKVKKGGLKIGSGCEEGGFLEQIGRALLVGYRWHKGNESEKKEGVRVKDGERPDWLYFGSG